MFNGTSNNPRNLLCVSTTRAVEDVIREKCNVDQYKGELVGRGERTLTSSWGI